MYSRIRSVFVLVFVAASVTWGCGGERVTTSQIPEAEGQMPPPLGKLAAGGSMTPALVVARVLQGQTPLSGVNVAFARSIFRAHGELRVVGRHRRERPGAGGNRVGQRLFSGPGDQGREPDRFLVEHTH